jgi:hypothetical protein
MRSVVGASTSVIAVLRGLRPAPFVLLLHSNNCQIGRIFSFISKKKS